MTSVPRDSASAIPAARPAASDDARRLKFNRNNEFHRDLRARVDRYFRMTGRSPRDCWQMYLKTAILFGSMATSYALLVFFMTAWWQAVPLAILVGFLIAAIGFNVQHDGGHRAYSRHQWVNRLMATSLDLLGASSYVWDHKHNTLHHTYANITGHDDDIEVGFLGRLSPHQKRLRFHRVQHFYLWILYGFLPVKWQLFDDFFILARGRIGAYPFPRPKGRNLAIFLGGKALFLSFAFVIPSFFHPFWGVVGTYLLVSWVYGLMLSVVFQLAHVVEEAEFPMPEMAGHIQSAWAVHQVETTVDFAQRNPLVTWYVGGLNFQIEHHLFPKICHIHYPKVSRIVRRACLRYGIEYHAHRTVFAGIASHFRWLRLMGQPAV
jgi:linoleoyl-CoA desaturase